MIVSANSNRRRSRSVSVGRGRGLRSARCVAFNRGAATEDHSMKRTHEVPTAVVPARDGSHTTPLATDRHELQPRPRHPPGFPRSGGHDNSPEKLDRRLDDALMETFPASDPVSILV
jgi:hypothetical protein